MDGNEFFCIYCNCHGHDFAHIIDHNIIYHTDCSLKINVRNRHTRELKSKDFNITPQDIQDDNRIIIPNRDKLTIKISRRPDYLSPKTENKRQRVSLEYALATQDGNLLDMSVDDIANDDSETDPLNIPSTDLVENELIILLPEVIKWKMN